MSEYIMLLLKLVIPILAAIYTINFGRWLKKQGSHSGAIGAYLWALLCIAAPAVVLWYNR